MPWKQYSFVKTRNGTIASKSQIMLVATLKRILNGASCSINFKHELMQQKDFDVSYGIPM
jgi:hypothetical protein